MSFFETRFVKRLRFAMPLQNAPRWSKIDTDQCEKKKRVETFVTTLWCRSKMRSPSALFEEKMTRRLRHSMTFSEKRPRFPHAEMDPFPSHFKRTEFLRMSRYIRLHFGKIASIVFFSGIISESNFISSQINKIKK